MQEIFDSENRKNNDRDDRSKVILGSGIAIDEAVHSSTAQAKIKYTRAEYNPQTRKTIYDDGNAHKAAIDRTFANGEYAQDPYTGAVIVKKQKDAKMQFGEDWQNHAAEADHIDPLSQIAKRTSKNPFLTEKDVKEIGNADDNFQVISRKMNQSSKDVGKGGSTQEDWANDPKRMEGVADSIESGESIEKVSERIKETGKAAEKRNDSRALKKSVGNAARTAHEAGKYGAKNSGINALTISGIMNIVSVIKGEKNSKEAVADTIKDGGKAAVVGYLTSGSLTVVSHTLSYSSSNFLQALAKSNVPAKVISAVVIMGNSIKKWENQEINTNELMVELGEKGLNVVAIGPSAAIGQAIIPIPVVGGAVGALVGSMLTSACYNEAVGVLKEQKLNQQEKLRLISDCREMAEQAEAYKNELQKYLNSYFTGYENCLDLEFASMQFEVQPGDLESFMRSAVQQNAIHQHFKDQSMMMNSGLKDLYDSI